MEQKNREIFSKWHSDLTLPVIAILNGRRSTRRLRDAIGEIEIEDLWLPYFCVSSNLSRAEIMVHRDGPLWIGLRASAGLPGVFPPLAHKGDLLIDGGFLRNLPADIMRDLTGGGITIAVDVSSELDMQYQHIYVDAISGWSIFWNRMNPWGRKIAVPGIAAVIQRAGEIASVLMQREALLHGVDLYIRMPVQRFGLMEFASAAAIIKTGYETARAALAEWLAGKDAAAAVRPPVLTQAIASAEALSDPSSPNELAAASAHALGARETTG